MSNIFKIPRREKKPRDKGLSILLDGGIPQNHFFDVIESHSNYIDFVKFGWCTASIASNLEKKIECLEKNEVNFFFGGTFFEKALVQDRIDQFVDFHKKYRAKYMEISNGSIDLDNKKKARYISKFSKKFKVLSEVGFKDSKKSEELHPAKWIEYIKQDLDAGASKVILESRESGTSGICRPNGELRYGLVSEILSMIPATSIIFEAPNKKLQTYLIQKLGFDVNLSNIAFDEIVSLETLRLGLRGDTIDLFEKN